jgi:hypothetical protein
MCRSHVSCVSPPPPLSQHPPLPGFCCCWRLAPAALPSSWGSWPAAGRLMPLLLPTAAAAAVGAVLPAARLRADSLYRSIRRTAGLRTSTAAAGHSSRTRITGCQGCSAAWPPLGSERAHPAWACRTVCCWLLAADVGGPRAARQRLEAIHHAHAAPAWQSQQTQQR